MAVRPTVLGAVRLVADDLVVATLAAGVLAGLGLVAVLLRVGDVDAHALEEALVAVVVDGDNLVVEDLDEGNGGLLAVELGRGPLADELTRLRLSVANVMSTVSGGSGGCRGR